MPRTIGIGAIAWNINLPLFPCEIESGGELVSSWRMIHIVEFIEHRYKLKASL